MLNELFKLRRLIQRPLAKLFPDRFRGETMVYSWVDAFSRYEAKLWDGRAHLFRVALDDSLAWSGIKLENDLGWNPLVGELVVVQVTGNHNSMCEEPYVRVLADALRKCLDEAHSWIAETAGPETARARSADAATPQ